MILTNYVNSNFTVYHIGTSFILTVICGNLASLLIPNPPCRSPVSKGLNLQIELFPYLVKIFFPSSKNLGFHVDCSQEVGVVQICAHFLEKLEL